MYGRAFFQLRIETMIEASLTLENGAGGGNATMERGLSDRKFSKYPFNAFIASSPPREMQR